MADSGGNSRPERDGRTGTARATDHFAASAEDADRAHHCRRRRFDGTSRAPQQDRLVFLRPTPGRQERLSRAGRPYRQPQVRYRSAGRPAPAVSRRRDRGPDRRRSGHLRGPFGSSLQQAGPSSERSFRSGRPIEAAHRQLQRRLSAGPGWISGQRCCHGGSAMMHAVANLIGLTVFGKVSGVATGTPLEPEPSPEPEPPAEPKLSVEPKPPAEPKPPIERRSDPMDATEEEIAAGF